MKSPSDRGSSRRVFLAGASTMASMGAAPWTGRAAASANDRIGIGLIGVGGRGTDHLNELVRLASSQNVQVSAVCDVWRKASHSAAAKLKQRLGHEPRQYTRFGDLLEQRDVDAVVIATPDFSHGTILNAALKAGKDVYIEKPMTIDLASARSALDLARAGSRVVQAGTQRRSDGHFRAAAKHIASGELGQISRVSASVAFNEPRWRRPVADVIETDVDWPAYLLHLPPRPFDARLLRCWQLFRDTSNGLPGLWMTHFADAVHMLTGASHPRSAAALGGIYVWKDGREHTDTFHAVLDYPEGFLFDWGMGLGNAAGGHFTIHGTKATLDADRWTVQAEGRGQKAQHFDAEHSVSHMENWLECLRSRQRPNADIEFGYQHVVATVMAAQALVTGRRQSYDPKQSAIISG
jgi:predicted dehydrogenase